MSVKIKFELQTFAMMPESIRGYKGILGKLETAGILKKIGSGKVVYLENPLEEIVLRYVPREYSRYGKYYVKYYGRNGCEINFDSVSILKAVMEGKRISKARYDGYHLVEDVICNRKTTCPFIESTKN